MHSQAFNLFKSEMEAVQTNESPHDKTNTMTAPNRRLGSAWASAQSDQSSLCALWVAKYSTVLHADSEDSDQTGRMPRLI